MPKYRDSLPMLNGDLFLTDGGLETTLVFHQGFDIPQFASFVLLDTEKGRNALQEYFNTYATFAKESNVGFILESVTWRASLNWGDKLDYTTEALNDINRRAITHLVDIRNTFETEETKMPISGCVGPASDAYRPDDFMTVEEAEKYHAVQIETIADTEADIVSAMTMTYAEEAIGITRAANAAGMPVVISFTVETDGKLPSGQPLGEAIQQVDNATDTPPAYYMINCAHPTHFDHALEPGTPWLQRIQGLRANASCKSHAELDECEVLDDGNPTELAAHYKNLKSILTNLNILGGCCGTDHRHIQEIHKACKPLF